MGGFRKGFDGMGGDGAEAKGRACHQGRGRVSALATGAGFCKAKNTCRARAEEYLKLAQMEFKAPPLLSDEEIAEVLKVADELAKWSADVYAYAQDEAVTKGKKWAGFKLVEGRSNRKYTDEEEVAQAAQKAGYTDIYKRRSSASRRWSGCLGRRNLQRYLGSWSTSRRAR